MAGNLYPQEPSTDIRTGLPVFSEDGQQLGQVAEVTPEAIKVDAPLRPDYWIAREHVLSFTSERVTLNFNAEVVDRYRSSDPPQERPP